MAKMAPLVSKIYCSSSEAVLVLVVRKRPHVVNGGGFVMTDSSQKVIFSVDGCGVLGKEEELIVRDDKGGALLLIRGKGGFFEALSFHKKWRAYKYNFQGSKTEVFSLKKLKPCISGSVGIRITTKPRVSNRNWDFEINGSFPDRKCNIINSHGNIVAQIGLNKEVGEQLSKDLYHVQVKPGTDQAFVCGVIAILDNMHGESTSC